MKHLLLLSLLSIGSITMFANTVDPTPYTVEVNQDTVIIEDVQTGEKRKVRIVLPGKADEGIITYEKSKNNYKLEPHVKKDPRSNDEDKNAGPIFGVTFSRLDLGLVKLIDNGSLTLSENNSDFAYRSGKTVNFGFDVGQLGYRFNDNFRLFVAAGFDWSYIRLKKNIIFQEDTTPLSWSHADQEYKKNKLTSTYLRLPLTFELRTKFNGGIGRGYFAFGPEGGILLKGTQRLKGKSRQKFHDDYNFTQVRYGVFARAGVGAFGIYAKYYFNDVFENSPNQSGLQSFAAGLMLGF